MLLLPKLMYARHARHPAKEADVDLVAGRLRLQVFGGANFGKHGGLLPLDAPALPLEFLAPLARRIGRTIRPLLGLDALRLPSELATLVRRSKMPFPQQQEQRQCQRRADCEAT